MQLRKKIFSYPIALFAVLTIALITVATFFVLLNIRVQQLGHTRLETIGLTKIFSEQIERNFSGIDLVLEGVQEKLQSTMGLEFSLDSEELYLLLGTRVMWLSQIDKLYLVDENGLIVNASSSFPVSRIPDDGAEYFNTFKHSNIAGAYIDRPVYSQADKAWMLRIARRINDASGNFRGVLVASVRASYFESGFAMMKLDYARPVALYRSDGILLASSPHQENMMGERPPELDQNAVFTASNDIRFLSRVKNIDESEEFTLSPILHFPLMVSVVNDKEEALAVWRETSIPVVMGAFVVCCFIFFFTGMIIKKIRREGRLTHALGEVSDRYQQTVDSVMDAIVGVDEFQKIVVFNPAAEKMFGYTQDLVLGQPLSMLIPVRFRDVHQHNVHSFKISKVSSRAMAPLVSITGLNANGSEFPIESTISQSMVNGQSQQTAVLRDVTERRRAERELLEMNEQLRALSIEQEKIRDEERGRIAVELHDDLGQQLTGLKLDVAWLSNRIKDGRMPGRDKVDALRHSIDQAIGSVRRISTELMPLVLKDLGFAEAVASQSREFFKRTGIEVIFDLEADSLVTSDDLSIALFRITQESMTNVLRHAQATSIHIRLFEKNKMLVLSIQDNGQGIKNEGRSSGFGLFGMRERAKSLGGNVSIYSSEGEGTTVQVEISLEEKVFKKASHEI